MVSKKLMALILVGGMTASISFSAGAVTKNVTKSPKTKVNFKQVQMKKGGNPKLFIRDNMKSQLDALVKSGKITQDVENKVVAYINKKEADAKAQMDKIKAMTPDQRKTYMQSQKPQKIDLATDLVSSGTLTQDEANTLKAALPQGHVQGGFKGNGAIINPANMQANIKSKLDALVNAGTITQAQEDSVTAYFSQQQAQRQAEMDKIKNMSAADRQNYLKNQPKVQRTAPLAALVTNGTLTEVQADAVNKAIGHFGGQRGFGRKQKQN